MWLNLDYPLLSGHLLVAEDRSGAPWMVELMYDRFDVYVGQRFSPAKVKRNPHYLRQRPDTPPPLYLPPKFGGVNVWGVYDLGDDPPRWPGRPDLSHIDPTLPDETLKRITRGFKCTVANRTGWIGGLIAPGLGRSQYCSACSAQCSTSCASIDGADDYLNPTFLSTPMSVL